MSPAPSRSDSRAELDDLISRLVDRPGSASISHGAEGQSGKGSRPNSVLSASQLSGENAETYTPSSRPQSQSIAVQTVGAETYPSPAPHAPSAPEPKREVVTYSKAVQTDDLNRQTGSSDESVISGAEHGIGLSKEGEEEIRQRIRKEVEEELNIAEQDQKDASDAQTEQLRYPLRTLDDDELKAVTSSDDFLDFVERSSKVIERALDEEYDVLADYELGGIDGDLEEDEETGKKRRGIREICQFYDERESKKRQVTDISFSPKVSSVASQQPR